MALQGQFVLRFAGDVPGAGHLLSMFAHGQASARLAIARQRRLDQHAGAQAQGGGQTLATGLGARQVEQDLAHLFVQCDRCIGGGVHTAGNAALDVAQRNLVGHQHGRLQTGATGLLQIKSRGFAGQRGGQHTFAHQIEVARVFHHRACGHVAQALAVQVEAVDQALQRGSQHVLVGHMRIHRVRTGEGDAVAAKNGDAANSGHGVVPEDGNTSVRE